MVEYSQNFLLDRNLVRKLINKSDISEGDLVLDIGAGEGIITREILRKVGENGKVIAVEIDRDAVSILEDLFSDYPQVDITKEDIKNYQLPQEKFKVFSNIPFNLTSEIMNKLLFTQNGFTTGNIVMQKEAAFMYGGDQIREPNTLKSIQANPFYEFSLAYHFHPADFIPQPRVDIVLLNIRKRLQPLIPENQKVDYLNFTSFLAQDRYSEGRWRKLFTKKQLDFMRKSYGLIDKGISSQQTTSLIKAFNSFISYTPLPQKELVTDAYMRHKQQASKLQKQTRTSA